MLIYPLGLRPTAPTSDRWVIWNVGQGLWITGVFRHECLHLDAGGERFPSGAKLHDLCSSKRNYLSLSHWDLDHIGGLGALQKSLPSLCLEHPPGGTTTSPSKIRKVQSIPRCRPPSSSGLHQVHWQGQGRSSNHQSHVFIWNNSWLFPGDSPASEEKKWVRNIPHPSRIRVLIAGHHGSRTSSSTPLLSRLSGLRLAIISARHRRYGHPHIQTVIRLREAGVPALRTESWGHLIFEL